MAKTYQSVWTQLLTTPFRQDWVTAGGLRTRFVEAGVKDAPPVIMLHGTAGSLENFAANIAAHAEHFRVFAFDMIGSGFTDKPDIDYETPQYVTHVKDFMTAMGLQRASLIGLSLGARVATRFAIDHPGMVDKLTLLSATAYFPAREIQAGIMASRANAAMNPTWENVYDILKDLVHDPATIWDDLIAVRLAAYSQPEMKQAMGHILALLDPAVYNRNRISDEDWKKIKAPTLIFAAIDHNDVFLETARVVAKLIPDVRIAEVKNSAHWPQLETPDIFNDINIKFLLGQ